MEKSKFELFQKNKIEGLQHIVGGMYATIVVPGGNRTDLVGHGDTWYEPTEGGHTSSWSDLDGGNKGDLIVAKAIGGNPDPNDPGAWTSPAANSVMYRAL